MKCEDIGSIAKGKFALLVTADGITFFVAFIYPDRGPKTRKH